MSYLFHESFNKNSLRFACPNIFIGIFIICWQIFLICVPVLFFYYIEIYNITLILCISFLFILFNGTRMRALGNIIHECCHYNYVPSKSANIKIGTLLSALELGCFVSYKKEHYSHHKYLGDILFDEDFKVRHKIGICNEKAFCLKGFIQIVLSPKNWFFILKSSIKMDLKNKNLNIIRLIYLVLFFVLSFIFNFKLVFFFIILPYLTSYQMMKISII